MILLELFFSLAGVCLIAFVGLIITIVVIVKTIRNSIGKKSVYNIIGTSIIIIISYCALVLISSVLLLSEYSSPSKVDTAPLHEIDDISFISWDEFSELLEIIQKCDGVSEIDKGSGVFHNYSFGWHGNPIAWEPGGVAVHICYFEDADRAVSYIQDNHTKSTYIRISENVTANLFYSTVYRGEDVYYATDMTKTTRTNISVSNIAICIYEQASFFQAGKWTTEFIALFVKCMIQLRI